MSTPFVHLKLHSEYSLMDSLMRIKPTLDACIEREMPALALTDICNMFAAVKFYQAALSKGIKPIFGSEICVESEGSNYLFTLIAKNKQGYQVIVEIISDAYLHARRDNGRPTITKDRLSTFNFEHIFVLSGGQKGELGQALMEKGYNEAVVLLQSYQLIFSRTNFFIELQRIGREGEESYIQAAVKLAKKESIPVVATNDVRFLNESDYADHEVRVGIYQGYTLLDERRKSEYTPKQYLRSSEEMHTLFEDIPQSLSNTIYIAQNSNVVFTLGEAVLPSFDIPSGITEIEYFAQVSYQGLEARFKLLLKNKTEEVQKSLREVYEERLQLEIDVICQMGFPGYFLIVADFIQWSKDNHFPVGPGRGSGAGSLVAYALKITDIDPIPYGLLFERFLNPDRVSMPDFDIDFCINARDKVIDYVAQKYGTESVSQIITYGRMAAKAVVRDVGRALGQPYPVVDRLAKMIPNDLGIKLKDAVAEGTPLYDVCQDDETAKEIIRIALNLEGLTRSVGKHAAGVVISPSKVTDYSPIYCEENSKQLVTQFDKKDVEEVGLVKFDFLGLRNLTIIDSALKIVNKQRALNDEAALDIRLISMQDNKTFELLKRGETTGIFQLESRGMKELIKRLRPDRFEEIIALVALYRPGPLGSGMVDDFVNRKHGRQAVSYPHPKLGEVLKETYGTILYQEQVMQIAQILSSYSLGEADLLRRAMGKKIPEEMAEQRDKFEEGAKKNGVDEKVASDIFDLMEEFAKYGFNKSHSAAYALISYQTAYLKAHYPEAFMAALLSSDMDNTDKVINFVSESQKMKLSLIPPHINTSQYDFTVNEELKLVYGLGAIKGSGFAAIEGILAEREANGVYLDLYDFCQRVDLRRANKRVCEALIYAGAMDGFADNRRILLETYSEAVKSAEQKTHLQNSGQVDLFGFSDPNSMVSADKTLSLQNTSPFTIREKLIKEKSVLGLFLSGHLIDEDQFWLNHFNVTPLNMICPSRRKEATLLAGVVVSITRRRTKAGKYMGILQIEDQSERLEMVVFNELYEQIKDVISVDQTVMIEGEATIDAYNDQLRINALKVVPIQQYIHDKIYKITMSLSRDKVSFIQGVLCEYQKNELLEDKFVTLKIVNDQYQVMLTSNLSIDIHALMAQKERLLENGISINI